MPRGRSHVAEVVVFSACPFLVGAGGIVLPVHAIGEVDVFLARDHRLRAGDRLRKLRRLLGVQILIGEGERPLAVVLVHLRQHGVVEEVDHLPEAGRLVQLRLIASRVLLPSAPVLVLVLPLAGVANAGLGLDVVPEHVFRALAVGPHVLARDCAGLAAQAFVEVEYDSHLFLDTHGQIPNCLSCNSW